MIMIVSPVTFSVRVSNFFFKKEIVEPAWTNSEMIRENLDDNKVFSFFLFSLQSVSADFLTPKTVHSLATNWNRLAGLCG